MENMNTIKEREADSNYSLESSANKARGKLAIAMRMKSEKGVVLVVVLVLSAVVLAVMTAMIYMITSGTQISGFQKRYKTALEAARGGNEILYQVIGLRSTTTGTFGSVTPTLSSACAGGFTTKLMASSSSWVGCSPGQTTIDPLTSSTYDMSIGGGSLGQYTYYAKVVGTVQGNSASLLGTPLYTGSVITGSSGGIGSVPVVSMPYLYAIEVEAENASNPAERAKLSILYQY